MAYTFLCVLFTTLCVGMLPGMGSQAVRLRINPEKAIAGLENDVQISCVPEDDGANDNKITMMEISRNDEDPIVFLQDCSNITRRSDMSHRFQAEGYIDHDVQKSYLNLTLLSAMSEDTGVYTCVMYYVDSKGHMKQETSIGNLNVERIDVKSLELLLRQLKHKVSALEIESKNMNDEFRAREVTLLAEVSDLKTRTTQQIHDLTDRVNYTTAFSVHFASKKSHMTSQANRVLILPDVIMLEGQGYDVKSGIFTAPRDGLYVFHVVIFANKIFRLELKKNHQVIAHLYAYDKANKEWNKSSVSSVVHLKVGDKVKMVQKVGGVLIHNNFNSIFTGYLIKAY